MAEFRDWLFLKYPSRLSLKNAANFLLFLNVAIVKGKSLNSVKDWIGF